MSTSLHLTLREHDEPTRLIAEGGIDLSTATQFREALAYAATRHDRLVVDLTAVDDLEGAGIDVLDDHAGYITAVLLDVHSSHVRALSGAGLDTLVAYQPRTTASG